MSERKPIQIECSIHGARGCECSSSLAEQKNAKKKKRSRRRSDQQRARGRVEREGGNYREALLRTKRPQAPSTLLGAALAARRALSPAARRTDSILSVRGQEERHSVTNAWPTMNPLEAELMIRRVADSIQFLMPSRLAYRTPPIFTKQSLLFQQAWLEVPLRVAQLRGDTRLCERVREVSETIDAFVRVLDRQIEESSRRDRELWGRGRWSSSPLDDPKLPAEIEHGAHRVRTILVEAKSPA